MSSPLFSPADDEVADLALDRYGLSAQRSLRMINLSENATYLMHDPGTAREGILRVHRVDYHSREAIESELDWLTAVRTDAGVSTPKVIPTDTGDRVVTVRVDGRD